LISASRPAAAAQPTLQQWPLVFIVGLTPFTDEAAGPLP